MPTALSKNTYSDCYDLFDRALDTPKGLRIAYPDQGSAQQAVVRLHTSRTLLRRESYEIYPEGDPAYGTSPYDTLIVRQPRLIDDRWYVYVEPRAFSGEIEELSA